MRVRFFIKGLLFAHEIVKMREGIMVSDDNRLAKVPFSPMPLPVYYTTLPLGWIASQNVYLTCSNSHFETSIL
jgi:hypothetical protein